MTTPRQIQFVRGNTQCVNHYVGPIGSFAINLDDWSIHIQDGVTPGGHIVSGGSGTGYGNTNVQVYLDSLGITPYSNANVQAYGLVFNGDLRPTGNNAHSLGSINHQWKDLFLSNSTVYLNGVPLSLNSDNNLTVNGKVIDLGNFAFDANRQYNINGFALENSDLIHGYTSRLAIPVNGSGDAELVNFYGNVNLTAGYNNGDLKTWTLGQDGTLTIPNGGKLGGLQFADGIDLYADGTMSYTQINYDNTNYIYADSGVSQLQTPNVNIIAATLNKQAQVQVADPDLSLNNTWTFDANGNIHLGGSGRLGKLWNDPGEATLVAGAGGYAAIVNSTGDQYIDADDSVVQIGTNWTSGAGNTWFFNKDGTVTFPDYTRQSTAYPGPQDLSNYAWNANVTDANVAMKGYVDGQITNLINNAPIALDTLKELADALGDDPNFAASITSMIGNVQANVNAVSAGLNVYAWNANLATYAWNANLSNYATTASLGNYALNANIPAPYSNVNVAAYLTTNNYLTSATANLSLYAWNGNASGGGTTYSNVNVAAYLATATITTTGNITTSGNIQGVYVRGDGGFLTNVTATILGNVVGTQPNVTIQAGGNLWVFDNQGNLTLPGNVWQVNYANGTPVTFATSGGGNYSNVDVANYLTVNNYLTSTTANLSLYAWDANVTAANVGMLGYVNSQVTAANVAWQTNAASQQQQISNLQASAYSNVNLSVYTGNISATVNGFSIGYRDIPQVSLAANTTMATSDAGKHYYSTASSAIYLTVANNATQSFNIGATINIVNQGTANIVVTPGSGVTLYLAGNTIAGTRTLSSYGMATVTKVASDTWWIVGVGLS